MKFNSDYIVFDSMTHVFTISNMAPPGFKQLGYFTKIQVQNFRSAGMRVWINKKPDLTPTSGFGEPYYMAYVEPWVLEMKKQYHRLKNEDRPFAGLTEWEFVLSGIPDKDSR